MLGELLKAIRLSFDVGVNASDENILGSIEFNLADCLQQGELPQHNVNHFSCILVCAWSCQSEKAIVFVVAEHIAGTLNAGLLIQHILGGSRVHALARPAWRERAGIANDGPQDIVELHLLAFEVAARKHCCELEEWRGRVDGPRYSPDILTNWKCGLLPAQD